MARTTGRFNSNNAYYHRNIASMAAIFSPPGKGE
jgi:hypothetical protein